jgi:hypothetical protein
LDSVIDFEGGRQLKAPRSVVRALDAIRFFWPPLSQVKADLADLVWLQLIKDGDAGLYRWIESYCATAAVISLGIARVDDVERARKLAELIKIVDSDDIKDFMFRHYIAVHLPGISTDHINDGVGLSLYCNVDDDDRDNAIRNKRLASPDHYRIYFALAAPSHVLKQEEFFTTWAAIESKATSAGEALLGLYESVASGTLTKADLLLERVKGGAYEVLSPVQCENLLVAFSNVMDEAYRRRRFDIFWVGTLWSRAECLIPLLLSRLEQPRQDAIIAIMFENGLAIGWLTSVLRHETFAHGCYGNRLIPEAEWLFTNKQLDRITEAMLGRYKTMSMHDIFSSPDPLSLLFAWLQAGDEKGQRRLVEEYISSDRGLIETLEKLISTIQSSDRGRFQVIKKSQLEKSMDINNTVKRIEELMYHDQLGERAKIISNKFDDGDDY